ncbi:MAG: hypothetical protein HQK51_10385 [Oligoflexia bacterium]|nr:hypothetical protein [Oligoflexia bacterium]
MRLKSAIEEKLYDNRLRDKFIADGRITKTQVDTYLDSLPDDQEKSLLIDLESPSTQSRVAKKFSSSTASTRSKIKRITLCNSKRYSPL